jgi:Ca2+-binding RTX toxin-like protein
MTVFHGTDGYDNIRGGAGNDQIFGLGGNDVLDGAGGRDHIDGGVGNDILYGSGGDTLIGGEGYDTFQLDLTAQSHGLAADFHQLAKGKVVVLADGTLLKSVESAVISLGAGDDVASFGKLRASVLAGAGDDHLVGGGGSTLFYGEAGDDTLEGGGGSDVLACEAGNDVLDGGSGIDRVDCVYAGASSIDLSIKVAQHVGASGFDTFIGIENISGSGEGDHFTGDDQANTLNGEIGDDTLSGGGGDDMLIGDYATFLAPSTKDVLDGGAGQDTLWGGLDSDTFVFGSLADTTNTRPDEIRDLNNNAGDVDRIDLSRIDADATQAGDQAFHLVQGHFTGHAGEALLTYVAADNHTLLQLDANSDGAADATIIIGGDQHGFTDFIL